jgi:hypothetical protein
MLSITTRNTSATKRLRHAVTLGRFCDSGAAQPGQELNDLTLLASSTHLALPAPLRRQDPVARGITAVLLPPPPPHTPGTPAPPTIVYRTGAAYPHASAGFAFACRPSLLTPSTATQAVTSSSHPNIHIHLALCAALARHAPTQLSFRYLCYTSIPRARRHH